MKTEMSTDRIIGWTRWEHGAAPVEKTDQGTWKIHWPDRVETYGSGRALMRALHDGRDPHLTVERYFKLGKHAPQPKSTKKTKSTQTSVSPQSSILDLFGFSQEPEPGLTEHGTLRLVPLVTTVPLGSHTNSTGHTKKRIRFRKSKPAPQQDGGLLSLLNQVTDGLQETAEGIKLGIDLVNRSHEVRKLLFAGFGKRIIAMGYEPDDVLQDVYRGLLARNKGKCPWDARKASFGHYVHMVCGCILSNYHRRYNRINSREQAGTMDYRDGARVLVDVAESSLPQFKAEQSYSMEREGLINRIEEILCEELDEPYLALTCLPYVLEGRGRREVSKIIGIREGLCGAAINEIKRVSLELLS